MPSALLSHQAAVLPVKSKWPRRFDAVALCVGSFAADLELVVNSLAGTDLKVGHSAVGLLVWVVPWTLALTPLFARAVGPVVARLVGAAPRWASWSARYFGLDRWDRLADRRFDGAWVGRACLSAVVGGATHLLLDFPSHQYSFVAWPWAVWEAPSWWSRELTNLGSIRIAGFAWDLSITPFNLAWFLESLVLGAAFLWAARAIVAGGKWDAWTGSVSTIKVREVAR
ncbi:MAG: hypothetical protein Kow0069_27840 [Promethearchaeota archaeon]